uniref:Uncharacterized protein n=1 Tax=Arundo donax TaxID=35708 RepID=A0A0A8YNV4_ARUDO
MPSRSCSIGKQTFGEMPRTAPSYCCYREPSIIQRNGGTRVETIL